MTTLNRPRVTVAAANCLRGAGRSRCRLAGRAFWRRGRFGPFRMSCTAAVAGRLAVIRRAACRRLRAGAAVRGTTNSGARRHLGASAASGEQRSREVACEPRRSRTGHHARKRSRSVDLRPAASTGSRAVGRSNIARVHAAVAASNLRARRGCAHRPILMAPTRTDRACRTVATHPASGQEVVVAAAARAGVSVGGRVSADRLSWIFFSKLGAGALAAVNEGARDDLRFSIAALPAAVGGVGFLLADRSTQIHVDVRRRFEFGSASAAAVRASGPGAVACATAATDSCYEAGHQPEPCNVHGSTIRRKTRNVPQLVGIQRTACVGSGMFAQSMRNLYGCVYESALVPL